MRTTHLPIAAPCHEDWDAMDRVARGRFCQSCVKQVYDLSGMTEGQARGLLREVEGSRICVRYQHDDDGRIRFQAPASASPTCGSTPRRAAWLGAAMMATAMVACTPHERVDATRSSVEDPVDVRAVVPFETIPHAEPIHVAKGEIEAIEPREAEPLHEVLGDMGGEPTPVEPAPLHTVKGDMAGWTPELEAGELAERDEPCDGPR